MRNRNYCAFQNTRILKFKSQLTLRFLLPSVILAELIGNRSLLKWAQEVIVHDWWISIRFVCFCVPGFISCARNCDWRQRKTQFACFWKAQLSLARNYFIMTKSQFLVQQICLPIFFFQALHQTLQTTKINLKKTVRLNSFFKKITVAIRFNLLQVCPSMPDFILYSLCCTLSLCFELRLCLCSTQFGVSSSCNP